MKLKLILAILNAIGCFLPPLNWWNVFSAFALGSLLMDMLDELIAREEKRRLTQSVERNP